MTDSSRHAVVPDAAHFAEAMRRFDAANAMDPNAESWQGRSFPKELLYAERMTHWLAQLDPNASEPLQLAARCQHIRRWEIPRDRYPMDRVGYLRWRTALYEHHAAFASDILREVGYHPTTIDRVASMLRKKNLKQDSDAQTLEDVACLVFLEFYFADFAKGHEAHKVVAILQRTWKKMSPRAHAAAMKLVERLPADARQLIAQAMTTP